MKGLGLKATYVITKEKNKTIPVKLKEDQPRKR